MILYCTSCFFTYGRGDFTDISYMYMYIVHDRISFKFDFHVQAYLLYMRIIDMDGMRD